MKIAIGLIIFICLVFPMSNGWAYELEKLSEVSGICRPMGLADINGDVAEEWVCLKHKAIKERLVGPLDTRLYVYGFDTTNKTIEFVWKSSNVAIEGGDYFDGKIYFGDLDGNGIREIILIGWRSRFDEETRGYPYEGNIYVFGWNGKKFMQELKTTKYFFAFMTRPELLAITDVFGTGKDAIITNQSEKLFLLEKEGHAFKERVLVSKGELGFIDFKVGDLDNDGKNEIICGVSLSNEHATKIYKYNGKEFEIIYRKTFVDKENRQIRIDDIRETKDGTKLVTYTYRGKDGMERFYKFIPKTKRYRGEKPEEWDNKLKEIEVKNPVFKEEPVKYPGLVLPKGEHHFADLDGDGADELINFGPKGVSIYRIK